MTDWEALAHDWEATAGRALDQAETCQQENRHLRERLWLFEQGWAKIPLEQQRRIMREVADEAAEEGS